MTFNSPVGLLSYACDEQGALTHLSWGDAFKGEPKNENIEKQLSDYFSGKLKEFTVPLNMQGTPFQKRVWAQLLKIPYGELVTYKDVSDALKSSPRAVGGAVGKNPVPIIVPCHRVVAKTHLGGYSGGCGLETKTMLLQLEKCI